MGMWRDERMRVGWMGVVRTGEAEVRGDVSGAG